MRLKSIGYETSDVFGDMYHDCSQFSGPSVTGSELSGSELSGAELSTGPNCPRSIWSEMSTGPKSPGSVKMSYKCYFMILSHNLHEICLLLGVLQHWKNVNKTR